MLIDVRYKFMGLFFLSALVLTMSVEAMDLSIPKEVSKRLKTKKISIKGKTVQYRVVYPKSFDKNHRYPVLLGLSGGSAEKFLVDYCYYVFFQSKHFEDWITIMPIAPFGKNHSQLDQNEIKAILDGIQKAEPVQSSNWIIAGSSFGGIGTFNFARATPSLFQGIVVMPGAPQFESIPSLWKDYTVILAVGENDSKNWLRWTEEAHQFLKGKVKNLHKKVMKGQGHIATPQYDMDKVYSKYFNLSAR